MAIRELSPGFSLLEIPVANKRLQPFGLVRGGAYAGLVDAAGFWGPAIRF